MERMKEYDVLGTNKNYKDECSYIVKHKGNNTLYTCKAIDLSKIEDKRKQLLISEINSLLSLKHSLNTVRCFEYILHTASDTLYVITEYLEYDLQTIINQSKNSRTFIDETFIWKLLYQIAKAFDAYNKISTPCIFFNGHISPRNVYLDSNFNVKVDFFITASGLLQNKEQFYTTLHGGNQDAICGNREKITTRWLSYLLYHTITLHKYKQEHTINPKIFKHYSKSLQNMVSMLHEESLSISSLIHHPNIVSHLYLDATPMPNNNTLRRRKMTKKDEPNQEKNKENINTSLRKKEMIIEEKEKELERRERDIYKKEQEINIMEMYVKDKLLRIQNLGCSFCKDAYGDLDSTTCSGDAGDTSIQPTTSKLIPKNITQPLFTNTIKKRINKSKFKSSAAVMTYL